jgi:kanosamine 6-kinase
MTWRPGAGVEEDIASLAEHLRPMAGKATAAGVAFPATVSADGTVVTWPSRPSWTGLDARALFAGLLPGLPVTIADDGDAAALAEADALGCADLAYVGVGTGVGGGFVAGGRMWPGPGRGSFEIGHMVIRAGGPLCACGRSGCLQAVASGPATLARAAAGRGPTTFAELRDGFTAGEAWARDAVADSCAAVATALIGVEELLHPSLIAVGGGFAAGLPGYVGLVADHRDRLARTGCGRAPITAASGRALSSLDGAILLAGAS